MSLLWIAGLLLLLGLAAESVPSWIAIRTVRRRHPELWVHSGRPTLRGNGDLVSAWPLVRYYRDRGWERPVERDGVTLPPVADPAARAFAEALRLPLLRGWQAGLGLGVLALVALLAAGLVA